MSIELWLVPRTLCGDAGAMRAAKVGKQFIWFSGAHRGNVGRAYVVDGTVYQRRRVDEAGKLIGEKRDDFVSCSKTGHRSVGIGVVGQTTTNLTMTSNIARYILASWALVLTESILRVNAPTFARPSTLMNSTASFIAEWAYWLGYQVARITDLYYLVKKYIGDDVVVLIVASWNLIKAPLEAACGYIAYYANTLIIQWILSVLVLCELVYIINKKYPAPFDQLRKQVTPVESNSASYAATPDNEDDADESASVPLQPTRTRRVHS